MNVKEKAGDFILDLAKLVFGGIIISGIMTDVVNKWVLYSLGIFVIFFISILGFVLLENVRERKES